MKRIVWLLLIILGVIVVVSGCVRGRIEPGEPEYQLEITVEVVGEINPYDGIYYIVLDADENPVTGPREDISFWDDRFYYIKLNGMGFHFAQVKDDSESLFEEGSISGSILQVTIALSDLGDPSSVDINVITTTDVGNSTYDYLDPYFTVYTEITGFQNPEPDSPDDSGDGGVDYDITNVTAKITIP